MVRNVLARSFYFNNNNFEWQIGQVFVRLGGTRSLLWSQQQTVPAEAFPALVWAQRPWSILHDFVWKPRVLCALTTCSACAEGPYYSSWPGLLAVLSQVLLWICTTKVTLWVRQSCPSVPVLHRLQSGQNIPAMPEACSSSEPLTADGKQSSSEDALLSPGVWPGGAWHCVPALAPLWDVFVWFECCSELCSVGVCCLWQSSCFLSAFWVLDAHWGCSGYMYKSQLVNRKKKWKWVS